MEQFLKIITNNDILKFFDGQQILYIIFVVIILFVGYKIYINSVQLKHYKNFTDALIAFNKSVVENTEVLQKDYETLINLQNTVNQQRMEINEMVTYCSAKNEKKDN